jgi:hypothetical protein
MNEQTSELANQETKLRNLQSVLKSYREEVVQTTAELSRIAEKGPTVFLLSFGSALLCLAMLMKLRPMGLQIGDLKPIEFVTVFVAGMLLLALGAYLRLFQYKTQMEIDREVRQSANELLRETTRETEGRAKIGAGERPPL